MKEQSKPEDVLFKRVFSEPLQAEGVLRTMMPSALRKRVDFSTLQLAPEAFVKRALKSCRNKLLFTVRLRDSGTMIYLLLVRRSTPEPLMPALFLCDSARIWEAWMEDNEGAKKIPAVIPLLMYHGSEEWKAPTNLHSIIDMHGYL